MKNVAQVRVCSEEAVGSAGSPRFTDFVDQGTEGREAEESSHDRDTEEGYLEVIDSTIFFLAFVALVNRSNCGAFLYNQG
ncbi:hypothetical protein GOP47_0000474 [Adiantum capillus-veneris]|uniref:Uncharacterized protein n=1 Tax=Adiantum capillus-veneris TaxID=13818 RepID=A0A9D4VE08_ADICA|nr:hypothetical protein GOP47_0000474 [Adiantum capillus-veneris]